MKNIKNNTNAFWTYVGFFLWPFLMFINSVRNLGTPRARTAVVLFFGLFGFTMLYNEEADSSRHAETFERITSKPFSEFFSIIFGLYSDEGQKPDFIMDLIGFIVSRITANSQWYFMALALVFGWMLMKMLGNLYDGYLKRPDTMGSLFIIFFLVLLPPMRIVSFRHYLGLIVFVYGIYQYYKLGDKKFLLVIASPIIIHYGFLMVVPLFFLGFALGNRNKIYYVLIILSFLFADQTASLIRTYGAGLDMGVEQAVKGYTHQKYLDVVAEMQGNRNVILNSYVRWTTLFMLFSLLYYRIVHKNFDTVSEKLYSMSLILFAFVNFTFSLESISNRFSILFQVLACVFFVHYHTNNTVKVAPIFKIIACCFLLLNGIILIRLTMEYMNFSVLVPFLPLALFTDSDVPVLDMIKP